MVQAMKKQQPKKGKGGSGLAGKKAKGGLGSGGKKTKRIGRRKVQCHNCGGDHFLWDCKEWKEIKEKLHSPPGKD